ncbi:MAG: hypothetical protein ABIJ21_01910 [Nanoarchaeota archaeon]
MKTWGVWITHDIDHIQVKEHYFRDLFLFRLLGVSAIEVFKGRRSFWSMTRLKLSLFNPHTWNHFDEWIKLEKKHKIPSTWFFAVNRGKSISYTVDEIAPIARTLKEEGFDLGLHGQHHSDEKEIRQEHAIFERITGESPSGIRMHYLHITKETFHILSDIYVYDSSVYVKKLERPKKTINMLEIPIHIMDTYLFSPFYANMTLKQAKQHTTRLLNQAKKKKALLVVDIHPHHLDKAFPRQREWILWLYETISEDKTCKKYAISDILKAYS